MRPIQARLAAGLFAAMSLSAQTPSIQTRQQDGASAASADSTLRFDVASVKLAESDADPLAHRQIRKREPGRIHYENVDLKDILLNAFDLKEYQVIGPDWLNTSALDIDATMRAGASTDQLRVMFQNLLADRFHMTFHWEAKELPAYSMVVAGSGLKMPESRDAPTSGAPPPRPELPLRVDADGFPKSMGPQREGAHTVMLNARSQVRGWRATTQDLANELSKTQLRFPVEDHTGLQAKYDFTLVFATPGWNGKFEEIPELGIVASTYEAMEPLPELASAMQSQLGLKLEQRRASVRVFVVDHLDRSPTGN